MALTRRQVLVAAGTLLGGSRRGRSASAGRAAELRAEVLAQPFEALKKRAVPKRAPAPDDWLALHAEVGQPFSAYALGGPVRAARYNAFDLVMLGELDGAHRRVASVVVAYARAFFGVPVRSALTARLEDVPADAWRRHPVTRHPQLRTGPLLEGVLRPLRPRDTIGVIALTAADLYPEEGWNFVFGQASLEDRVGVWSLARLGDPAREFERCAGRAARTAVHEMAHMLSLPHCIAYECVVNGSNSLRESDQAPAEPCPICLQKLCWNTGADPVKRAEALVRVARDRGLTAWLPLLEERSAALRTL
ncbi:MAG: hypothetical protein HY904_20315 [Deltaproteobacteria bacterium]|nr:hypothetical protein [Deltaproteobacteria bacterium]